MNVLLSSWSQLTCKNNDGAITDAQSQFLLLIAGCHLLLFCCVLLSTVNHLYTPLIKLASTGLTLYLLQFSSHVKDTDPNKLDPAAHSGFACDKAADVSDALGPQAPVLNE